MRQPVITPEEAEVLCGILMQTWIPNGEEGETFQEAVRKLAIIAQEERDTEEVPPKQ